MNEEKLGLTPLPNGWDFRQFRIESEFYDGTILGPPISTNVWTDDTGTRTMTLDNNNNLYMIDAPNIAAGTGTQTLEDYLDLYNCVTWNRQACSSTNNFWNFEARSKANQTPEITYTNLGTGFIQPPANAFYPPQ